MTPTGNQLERQSPRPDPAVPDTPAAPDAPAARGPHAPHDESSPAPHDTARARPAPHDTARARPAPHDTVRARPAPPPVRRVASPPGGAFRAGTRPRSGPKTRLTPRGVVVVCSAGVILVLALALLALVLLSPSTPGADGPPPACAAVVIRGEAASVTFGPTGAWVADDHTGSVRRFNIATGAAVGRPIQLGGRPIAVASGFGRIWVADISGNRVWEIDPKTAAVVGTPTPVASGPVSLAAGDGGVWVASLVAGTVSLIDPRTGQVVASGSLPDGAVRLAIGPDGVWVSGQTDSLTRVDPHPVNGTLQWRTVDVGQGPFGVGVGAGSVWVANVKSGSVSRVDPASMRVTATYTVGGAGGGVPANPEMVTVWHNRLWVADAQEAVVVALDPATGHQVGRPVPVPGVIRQLVVDNGGTLWGTTANPGTVVRFGS